MALDLPEILNIPPKLLPIITRFNDYKYFLIEGGRGSAKTQSVGRVLSWVAEQVKVRIVCGREQQNSIEESVYTVLKDLIQSHKLAFDVYANKLIHRISGSETRFKGFREQGAVNIKGLEGVDILWVDEAQSITELTLNTIIPTIRKDNAKLFFTMNRYLRDDAVPTFLAGREDCLHIKINYFDNPHCPLSLKIEAEECRRKSEREYRHIWLGEPLATADDYLFNYDKLYDALDVQPFGEIYQQQRVLSIDFAAQGNDQCVATVLDRLSATHWGVTEQIAWDEPDAMVSTGRIVNMIGKYKPTLAILDVGGMGHVVHNRLTEVGMKVLRFDGASTIGVDTVHYANARAEMYYLTKDWFDCGYLCLTETDRALIKELEKIRMKTRSDGRRLLQSKVDMKKELRYSPDRADSLAMAIFAAVKYLGNPNTYTTETGRIQRLSRKPRKN